MGGFLLGYNIKSKESFQALGLLISKIHRAKDSKNVPIVIAGNKCDLRDPSDTSQVTKEEAQLYAAEKGCPFMETSAKEKINSDEVFYEVVREIRRKETAARD